jgi:hypothetical protein
MWYTICKQEQAIPMDEGKRNTQNFCEEIIFLESIDDVDNHY